jgi:hypothetical protein
MTWEQFYKPESLNASYEGDDLYTGEQLRAAVKAAVAAEQTAVFQTIEEFMGSEKERHPMFSDGYDYALSHIQQFVKGRQT